MSPGDFERMFIEAEDSETKEGLRVEEATVKLEKSVFVLPVTTRTSK